MSCSGTNQVCEFACSSEQEALRGSSQRWLVSHNAGQHHRSGEIKEVDFHMVAVAYLCWVQDEENQNSRIREIYPHEYSKIVA